ncbi:hypothetical protein DFH01_11535 [Falsiroseomonas bella]|uniref:PEP-CTERM sorting domain-containing protein n=1 Tax=Falsiroseomonas bella TaxID=2184016 RepID=A0A317FIJ8_9PROT|nr:hypothetical protein [Falsiroseomonas bella]PWS37458.1 hypothetical protein DFH01_11535 [Falsiroseomonas bella]
MPMRGVRSAIGALAAIMLAAGSAQAATFLRTNYTLTVTPTGPTELVLDPGEAFSITGSWSAAYNAIGCPGCPTQLYLVFFAPVGQPGDPANYGQINLFDSVIAPVNLQSASGAYAGTFAAPNRLGTYYVGANHTLNFPSFFSADVSGSFSQPDPWAYRVTVAEPVAVVSAPAALLVFAPALLALGLTRRRA